jgi:exo-beta-1,3-glucanase (GH17 family)
MPEKATHFDPLAKIVSQVFPVPMTFTPGTYTRAATTVTAVVTEEIFVCPFQYTTTTTLLSTNVVTVSAPGGSPTMSPPASSPAAPVQYAWTSSVAQPAPSSSYSAPSNGSSGGGFATNGNKWAFTYTPYTSTGQCKTADEVMADITVIAGKGFLAVRLYATDCSGLQNVGAACQANNLKMIIGVFIESSGIQGAQDQVTDIAEWGKSGMWEIVILIVIGNEAIFNKFCTPDELAGFISSAKSTWQQSGYNGPCTTTEPLSTLQEVAGSLCGVIDVVAANIQAFFTSTVVAEEAGTFVSQQLELVGQCCPGLDAYNLESGWPSAGQPNGQACPGKDQQQKALHDILDKAGSRTCFFSFANDLWKDAGDFNVEQTFGCIDQF